MKIEFTAHDEPKWGWTFAAVVATDSASAAYPLALGAAIQAVGKRIERNGRGGSAVRGQFNRLEERALPVALTLKINYS